MAKVQVTVQNVERTPLIQDFSLEWRQNGRAAGSMRFVDNLAAAPSFEPAAGQTIGVFYDGVRVWSGNLEAHTLDHPKTNIRHSFRVVSLEKILDRRNAGARSYHRERFTAEPNFDILTAPGHTFKNGYQVSLTSDDTLPFGLQAGVPYWVVGVNGDDFQLSQSEAGPPIDFTDGGTGPHFAWWNAGYILRDLLAERANGENLDLSQIQIGIPLDKRIYKGERLTDAAEELAAVCGYVWSIDENFVVRFAPRDYTPAAFSFAEPSTGVFSINKTSTLEDFANVIQLRIGWAAYAPTEDNPATDGVNRVFELSFIPEEIVAVLVNGEPMRFGVENVDSGVDFYWNPGEKRFTSEPTADPVTASDTLIIQYRVLGGNIITVEDTASIAERSALEGNSGRHEVLIDAEDIVTVEAGETRAASILAARNQINRVLEATVKTMMLPAIVTARPSQLVTVDLPKMGISGETYLIDTQTMRLFNGDECEFRLRLLSGERIMDEIAFFKALAGGRGGSSSVASSGITSIVQSVDPTYANG